MFGTGYHMPAPPPNFNMNTEKIKRPVLNEPFVTPDGFMLILLGANYSLRTPGLETDEYGVQKPSWSFIEPMYLSKHIGVGGMIFGLRWSTPQFDHGTAHISVREFDTDFEPEDLLDLHEIVNQTRQLFIDFDEKKWGMQRDTSYSRQEKIAQRFALAKEAFVGKSIDEIEEFIDSKSRSKEVSSDGGWNRDKPWRVSVSLGGIDRFTSNGATMREAFEVAAYVLLNPEWALPVI